MGSLLKFDISLHQSPSPDIVPPLTLIRSTYTAGWVPSKIVRRHAGAALLHGMFETPQQRLVVVFVPTEAFWQIARSQPTQRILEAASFWRFFRLRPWGLDYRHAWELQCSLDRDGLAMITGFDGHPVQFTPTRQII